MVPPAVGVNMHSNGSAQPPTLRVTGSHQLQLGNAEYVDHGLSRP